METMRTWIIETHDTWERLRLLQMIEDAIRENERMQDRSLENIRLRLDDSPNPQ